MGKTAKIVAEGEAAYENGGDRKSGFWDDPKQWLFLYRQDKLYTGMVGKRGQCNLDHPSQTIRKDLKYEHAGKVLFRQIWEQRGFVSGTPDLGGKIFRRKQIFIGRV